MKVIETKKLVKIYTMGETEVTALKGVDLSIEAGEFVAVTGYSGSGKSTLMHLLGCLDTPTSGSYVLDGVDVSQATRDELAHIRNQKIGFVFQKFYLLPDLTAVDNVALPQLYAGTKESDAREMAKELISMVGLGQRAGHFPYQLSGGQQQRIAIARALVNNPRIIFADEPTGNLDSESGSKIMDMFTNLNKQKNVTVVLVTHEARIAQRTQRIIEMIDGNIVKDQKVA